MDILFELFVELILEGSVEISKNKKISKWIRYPLIIIIIIFFSVVILGTFIFGIYLFNENIIVSLLVIGCSIFLLIGSIIKFKKIYLEERELLEKNI